jgi:protein SCO1/2
MQALQTKLPKSVGLVSFTVDPDHDSPEVLSVYARKFSADPQRWSFVTGDKAALLRLFRDGFSVAYDEDAAGNISHATTFVLVDAQGRLAGYYDGLDSSALDRLVADAKRL